MAALNRALYSGLDFDTIEDDLRAELQVKFAAEFNDFAVSSLGILLLDMVAFGLDGLSFYLDRRASDTYLATARTRRSVSKLTRQIGYKMGAAVASSVDLQVAVATARTFAVSVPARFQFLGPNGLIFETAEAVTFDPGSGPEDVLTIPVYEGETVSENFTSDGSALQQFDLSRVPDQKFIVQGTVVVTVDGAEWDEAEFITFDAVDQYEIDFNGDPPTISFGDGVAGNIPPNGASIVVTYVASRGLQGLVNENTIQAVVNPLVVNFETVDLVVNNPLASVAGDDRESLVSAKVNGPKVFKTRGAAVTREDYESLANAFADPLFGRVAVAQAFSTRSAEADLTVQGALSAIQGASVQPLAAVTTGAPLIETEVTNLGTQTAAIADAQAELASLLASAEGSLVTATTAARESKDRVEEVLADASGIGTKVTDGKNLVDGLQAGATSQLSGTDRDALQDILDRISTESSQISSAATTMQGSLNSQITEQGKARQSITDINAAGGAVANITAAAGAVDVSAANIQTQVDLIEAAVVDTTATVAAQSDIINAHFDKILSNDCKANLITVPILARDASGFYAAPSLGLIDALERFLEARKEVTQSVEVVSGGVFLLPVVLSLRVGVIPGNSESTVKAAVEVVVDGLLRDRKFGKSLYRSQVDIAVSAVEGVSFVDVTINGHLVDGTLSTSALSVQGNLLVPTTQVATKGQVTVTTVVDEEASGT